MFIKKGDVIKLNKHTIVCGDSQDVKNYSFMQKCATMTLTSPPYNFQKKVSNSKSINYIKYIHDENLSDDEYLTLCKNVLNNCLDNSRYVFWNVSEISNNKKSLCKFRSDFIDNLCDTIIWQKSTSLPAMQSRVLNSDFEYIYIYTNKEKVSRLITIGPDFRGTRSNIIKTNRAMKTDYSQIHSAVMSMELASKLVKDWTNENDLILDPFGGIGTTAVACEKLNRMSYSIELEPLYCEAIINRFIQLNLFKTGSIIRGNETINIVDVFDKLEKFVKVDSDKGLGAVENSLFH